jgi:DNA-binding transcriptional ArsR family regulator
VGHGANGGASRRQLDAATAKTVATTLQALATPSRLMILATLREGPRSVGDLVQVVGMEQSAVSHQLRLLRTMGLVESERHGRSIVYSLFDDHLAELIDQAIYHSEHLRLGGAPDVSTVAAIEGQ